MMTDIIFSTTTQLAAAIRSKQISAVEALEAHLAQIEKHNAALNAVVIMDVEGARERAHQADAALARGENGGVLHGVPFTLKDAFSTAGLRSTVGFPPLDHVPQTDATVVARLKAAGANLIGKTNVATLLGDYQTGNPIFGRTNNPWNVERTPGGSSGGAAAALASGMTPFEIATDLSGSIRIPAHFCGVFGLKPTEKRVSMAGVVPEPYPSPRSIRIMSCIGPMARSVDDLALLYSIIAGSDGVDTEVPPMPIEPVPTFDLKQLRVAVAPNFAGLPLAAEVRSAIDELAGALRSAGATVEEAALPGHDLGQDLANAGELIGMIVGAFQPSDDSAPVPMTAYLQALHQRDQSIIAWEKFFDQWDVLLCPPAMSSAFAHTDTGSPISVDGQPTTYWAVSAHTTLFNYTGHPAVVMPYKLDGDNLPVGVQLVGRRWDESRLLGIAQAVSQVTGEFQRPPGY